MRGGELVAIRGVGHVLPDRRWDSGAIERRIRETNPGLTFTPGLLAQLSGIRERRYADDCSNASDLAALAARRALVAAGKRAEEVDLLIFASASQDLAEPATAHIVQDLLGTQAAVFDI
jgi:3-oxoacyl-[acyl-carrier-protein] synthase III